MAMLLKVLNKVNIRALIQTYSTISTYTNYFLLDLLLFTKLMKLLVINHSLSERWIVFVLRLLKFSHVLVVLLFFPAVELDNVIRFSTPSTMSGLLWHSSKWACQFVFFFQYMPGLELLACTLDTDLNYVTIMLQLPFLEPLSKVKFFRGKMQQLLGVFSWIDM